MNGISINTNFTFSQNFNVFLDILHTVGPRGHYPKQLQGCYESCLQIVRERNLKSVVRSFTKYYTRSLKKMWNVLSRLFAIISKCLTQQGN